MPNKFHKDMVLDDNHAVISRLYVDIAARDADSLFHSNILNVNKTVRVDSPLAYYILVNITPTWESIGSSLNDSFLELIDVDPTTYALQGGKVVQVNAVPDGLEFGQILTPAGTPLFAALTVDTDTLIVDSALSRVAIGNTANPLTDLTIFQGANSNKGLTLSGQGVQGNLTNQGVSVYNGVNATSDQQLWISNYATQGQNSATAVRIIVDIDVPIISAVGANGLNRRSIQLGDDTTGSVGIGEFPLQANIESKLHIKTGTLSNIGLIIQGVASQTADLFQIKDSGGSVQIKMDPLGSLSMDSTVGVFRLNRLTEAERDALTPLEGMSIFNTDSLQEEVYNGTIWVGQKANDSFLELTDTPVSYTGVGLSVEINGSNDGLVFGQNLTTTGTPTFASAMITGNLSAGSGTITGDLTVDTTTLVVDSTNNRVGIGIAVPVAKLHVNTELIADVGLVVQGIIGQTGDILQLKNGAGLAVTRFHANNDFTLLGAFRDTADSPGTMGQVLSSLVTGTEWVDNAVGNVVGPVTATDEAIARFNLATGDLIQNSTVLIDDIGTMTIPVGAGLSVDSPTLVVDATNNRVGIGIASPTVTLDIVGNALITGSATITGDLTVDTNTLNVHATESLVGIGSTTTPLTDLTIYQKAGNTKGISFSGIDVFGFQTADGISIYNGVNAVNNMQLFMATQSDQGSNTSTALRIIVGNDVPVISAVRPDGIGRKKIQFGDDTGGDVGIGGFALQADIKAKFHIKAGLPTKVGLIVEGDPSQTADLVQIKNSSEAVVLKIEDSGLTEISTTVGASTFIMNTAVVDASLYLDFTNQAGARAIFGCDGNGLSGVGQVEDVTVANFNGSAGALNFFTAGTLRGRFLFNGDFEVDINTFFVDAGLNRVGLVTATPNSTLQVNGTVSVKRTAITTSFTGDFEVIWGVTTIPGGGLTLSIQTEDIVTGRLFILKDESGTASPTDPIIIDTQASEMIDGLASVSIEIPYGVVRLYSDGSDLFSW